MSSSIIAENLTNDIKFMIDFKDNDTSYWYDELDFDINEVAKRVTSNFTGAKLIEINQNGFKFRWNNMNININNYDEYN